VDGLEDSVDTETSVWEYGGAFAFDDGTGEIIGVNATGEELGVIVVY
jgi:hypothetical protein